MRDAFLQSLIKLAEDNPKLMLLTGDLGFGVFEKFIEQFPKQYLNMGVAEQNMMGVASGLAMEGHTIFTYSIANFATFRCLEQIRNDACYHGLNINMVASGGGFSYGTHGMSHHATEDLGILRVLPDITIVAPSDAWEAGQATSALAQTDGVGYLRLEKSLAPTIPKRENEVFELGKARCLREGKDVAIIACGSIVADALRAADMLAEHQIQARVISMHTIKPLDTAEIIFCAKQTQAIVTVEEHMIDGGLGSAVAEICLESSLPLKFFHRIGLNNTFSAIVGDQQFLRHKYSMDAEAIMHKTLQAWHRK